VRRHKGLLLAATGLIAATTALPAAAQEPALDQGEVQTVIVQVAAEGDAEAVAAAAGATPVAGPIAPDREVVGLEVSPAGLRRLRADHRVQAVLERGTFVEATLAQAVPKVGAPGRHAAGFDGTGKVIAVIDTGVATTFGGTLVGQACLAATRVGSSLDGHCGPSADRTRAFSQGCFDAGVCTDELLDAQAARPCTGTAVNCQHGTAVAAVAARHDAPIGVAPGAGVYAVRVFNPAGTGADLVDIYLALDHVVQMVDAGALDVSAVNLSVATSAIFTGDCRAAMGAAGTVYEQIFSELRARGIPAVVASGNDGSTSQLGFPACLPGAVSVGATDLDDDLASFSNRGAGLDLLAPGADEASGSSVNGMDIPGNSVGSWAGTSFAAPAVAGGFTLLALEYPEASVTHRTWFLQAAGVPVVEGSRTYRRLMLRPPAQVLLAQRMFPGEAPIGGATRVALGDVDGDGVADVVAHNPGRGVDRISYGGPGWRFTNHPLVANATYLPVVANVTGAADGPDDIIWYSPGTAADYLWAGQADRNLSSTPVTLHGTWTPHLGDFDGDGWDDVLWYAPGPASDLLWYGGPSGPVTAPLHLSTYVTMAVGDFDGDGHDDVLLDGAGTASDALWLGGARGTFAKTAIAIPGTAKLVVADLDGDGDDDVVVYRAGPASDQLWRGGPNVGTVAGGSGGFASTTIAITHSYVPVVGDLDGDGDDEILWYAAGPTPDPIWFGQPSGLAARTVNVNGTYFPQMADVDGVAGDDILWFRTTATVVPVWWSYEPP